MCEITNSLLQFSLFLLIFCLILTFVGLVLSLFKNKLYNIFLIIFSEQFEAHIKRIEEINKKSKDSEL